MNLNYLKLLRHHLNYFFNSYVILNYLFFKHFFYDVVHDFLHYFHFHHHYYCLHDHFLNVNFFNEFLIIHFHHSLIIIHFLHDHSLAPPSRLCASGFIIIRSRSRVVMGAPPYSELGLLGMYAKRILRNVMEFPPGYCIPRFLKIFWDTSVVSNPT